MIHSYHLRQAREAIEGAEYTVRDSVPGGANDYHQRKLERTLINLLSAINELSRWAEQQEEKEATDATDLQDPQGSTEV